MPEDPTAFRAAVRAGYDDLGTAYAARQAEDAHLPSLDDPAEGRSADDREGTNPDWLDAGAATYWKVPGVDWANGPLVDLGSPVLAERTGPDSLGGEFASRRIRRS